MMNNAIFSSENKFSEAFRKKLLTLLNTGAASSDFGLSAFILVCANAYFDANLLATMDKELKSSFLRIQAGYTDLFARGQIINERYAEDLLVFLKMSLVGLDRLQTTEHRQSGHWKVQFNHLRSFRPQRAAAKSFSSISIPFNDQVFHYDKNLCERESFWAGMLEGRLAYFLYNKYPFARLHTLLIPEPEQGHRQFLEKEFHTWVWQVTEALSAKIPGFGVGYNCLGSFASVNHLHFQTFIEPAGMPVASKIWKHNGGTVEYPVNCSVFTSPDDSWAWIDAIYRENIHAFNLLYTPGKIYCFKRKRQGTFRHARWTSGFAWFEMSGNLITFSKEDFNSLTREQIEKEYKTIRIR